MGALADWIIPYAEPLSASDVAQQREREAKALGKAAETPEPAALAEAYDTVLGEDGERLKSVEGRLGSLLGLTSLTATLLFSGILAIANGTLGEANYIVRSAAVLCIFYLSAQIVVSTLAAVRGLSRTAWLRQGVEDLMPATGDQVEANRLKAQNACKRYFVSDHAINFKVTQMAVAHTAVRNFAVGSALFAALGLCIVLTQTRESALSKTIQKDTRLQQLLRGSPGVPGPQGPAGVCLDGKSSGQAQPNHPTKKAHNTLLGSHPR